MRISIDVPATGWGLTALLEGIVVYNMQWLVREGRTTPALYNAGVVYKPEPPGREDWWTIPQILKAGWGDCEDLVCWRTAELRVQGIKARACVVMIKSGLWHVFVRLPDGDAEDPSSRLGMPVPEWLKHAAGVVEL